MVQHCSIEFLPNIRQLVVQIPINVDNIENNSKLFINRATKCLHTNSNAFDSELLISVPGCILLESLSLPLVCLDNFPQINRIDNVLVLQFRNITPLGQLRTLQMLQSAKSLQGHCNELVCSSCSSHLIQFNDSVIFKDLPNEHWLELLDCWSCHDNEFAPIAERALNQKNHEAHGLCGTIDHCHIDNNCSSSKSYNNMNNSSHGLILPSAGKVYLGTSFVLMHLDDFKFDHCSSCNTLIGEEVHDSHIKLYRDSIKFKLNDSSCAGCLQESFSTILMHRILDTIDNHSTFHFVLKSSSSNERIYLRPVNWNIQVYDFDSQTWRMAFKLGFTELTEASHVEAETIICTSSQFKQIKDQVQGTHEANLFNSSLKFPGSDSSLKLSYLIN